MPQVCKICVHSQRRAIDAGLRRNETYRALATRFSVSKDGLARHFHHHLRTATKSAEIRGKKTPALQGESKTTASITYHEVKSSGAVGRMAAIPSNYAEPETPPVATPPFQVDQDILILCRELGEISGAAVHEALRQAYPVIVINLALVRCTIRGMLAWRVVPGVHGDAKLYRLKEPVADPHV